MDATIQINKQVAVYARVSSSNQENEGTIETQLSAVREYAKNKGYIIIKEYLDNGWSGDSIVRPDLDRLRVDAKKKIWDSVLMYDPDRLARRYSYQELIMDELREAGIEVLFVTTPAPSNGIEKILYGVQGLFAEYERAKITERFRLGKVRKANEGHIIVSEAPYGYTFIPKQGKKGDADFRQGYYKINEYEAEIVNAIFSWVVEDGLTIRAIIRKLQAMGIPPRKSKRGVWNTSTISTLLRNKTYIGEGHFGASYAVVPVNPIKKEEYRKIKKTSRRSKPETEWIKIPTPKILDEKVFYRVQEKVKSNFDMSSRNTKNEYLLSGKIWCLCGKRRAGEGVLHGKHLYYRCTNRIKNFPLPATCNEKGINAKVTDNLVWNEMAALMTSPELLKKQIERWLKNQHSKTMQSTIDPEVVRREVDKLKAQEDRLTKAYGEGLISIDQLKQYLKPIRNKVEELIKQKEILTPVDKNEIQLPQEGEIETFAKRVASQLKSLSFESKKVIIRSAVEKIITSPEELQVYGYIPITKLNDVPFCSSYRNGVNTIQHSDGIELIPFQFEISLLGKK